MKKEKTIQAPKYTDLEREFRKRVIDRMLEAKTMRAQPYPEFDDMDYLTYWKTNAKAANAYLPPKVDEQDVRVTTGTTMEKKNTLLANLLNLNLEPDIEAYDLDDKEFVELGQHMEDMVRKSRKIEEYDTMKRPLFYNEFLAQGCIGIEEEFNEYKIKGKKLGKGFDLSNFEKMKWEDDIDRVYSECSSRIVFGPNLYFGNIREPNIQMQPFIVIRHRYSYAEAKAKYGDWARWENVPEYFTELEASEGSDSLPYNNWTLEEFKDGYVEELRYMDKWSDDFMIFLNGVSMFPVWENGTFPLSGILNDWSYPVSWAVSEPITNFVYGKSIPSKTKVDQALMDEFFKGMVIKTRKSYMPPLANNTGEMLSKRVFWAGNITDDVNPDQIKEIGTNTGISNAEMNFMQYLDSIINKKSVDPIMEGQSGGDRTAREVEEMKKQSMISLGLIIGGVISLENQMTQLRIKNIIKNWTRKMSNGLGDEIYRTISIDTDFEDGTKGIKEIEFIENLPDESQVYAEEKLRKEYKGENVRKVYMNPKVFQEMKLKWYTEINPTQKQSNALRRAQFEETVQKAIAIFAPLGKMPNMEYLAEQWAIHAELDPNKFWQQAQPMETQMGGVEQQQMMATMTQGGGTPGQGQMNGQMMPKALPQPSVNTLQNA